MKNGLNAKKGSKANVGIAVTADGRPSRRPRTRLSSVTTAVRLLKLFSVQDYELGISELAKRLGVAKSTVHRLASALLDEGLLEQNPENNRYRLGVALFGLGTLVRRRMEVVSEAKAYLTDLRSLTGENVRLAILTGANVVYVNDFESPHPVRLRSSIGLSMHRPVGGAESHGDLVAHTHSDQTSVHKLRIRSIFGDDTRDPR